jgi:hypothetical protein
MERSRSAEDRGQRTEDRRRRAERPTRPSCGFSVLCSLSWVLLFLVCGCAQDRQDDPMAGSYYLSPYKDLHRLGRVALLALGEVPNDAEIAGIVTDALFLETQKRQVFGVMRVRPEDPAWQNLPEHPDAAGTLRQWETARRSLHCNGLLVGTVSRYEPYPHMVLGLRLKLFDLVDGQLLWGLEQVWDASDRSIQKRIKAFLREDRKTGHSSLREELVVVSPLTFSKFVAYEVAGTFERKKK